MLAQKRFGLLQVGVDIVHGCEEHFVHERRDPDPELVVETRGAEDDEAWRFEIRISFPEALQGRDDGVSGVLGDGAIGYVVTCGYAEKCGFDAGEASR
jgi:hypothetical protein